MVRTHLPERLNTYGPLDPLASITEPPGVRPKIPRPKFDPKNETNPGPVIANRWRNLYFTKDGKCGKGRCVFDSEAKAKRVVGDSIAELMMLGFLVGIVFQFDNGVVMSHKDFAYHLQIPWEKT